MNLKTNYLKLAGLLACLALLSACGQTPTVTPEPITLNIAVAEAGGPLMADLADAYQAEYPHVSFRLAHGDSDAALDSVLTGQVDLALVSHISTSQTIWLTVVAIDNIAIAVHPDNPIRNLGLLQVRDAFHGRASAWSEVGGAQGDVTVITREPGAEIRVDFEERVLEGRNVTLNAIVAPSTQAVVEQVSSLTMAVGYLSMSEQPAGVRLIAVDGVVPTPLTAADRSYPLNRPLYLVAVQEPGPSLLEGGLRDFVSWVLSPSGQAVVGQRYGRVK